MSLNERILADLRRTYLSAVQEMALFPEGFNRAQARREPRGEYLAHGLFHCGFLK